MLYRQRAEQQTGAGVHMRPARVPCPLPFPRRAGARGHVLHRERCLQALPVERFLHVILPGAARPLRARSHGRLGASAVAGCAARRPAPLCSCTSKQAHEAAGGERPPAGPLPGPMMQRPSPALHSSTALIVPPNTPAPQPENEYLWSSVSLPVLRSRRRPRPANMCPDGVHACPPRLAAGAGHQECRSRAPPSLRHAAQQRRGGSHRCCAATGPRPARRASLDQVRLRVRELVAAHRAGGVAAEPPAVRRARSVPSTSASQRVRSAWACAAS